MHLHLCCAALSLSTSPAVSISVRHMTYGNMLPVVHGVHLLLKWETPVRIHVFISIKFARLNDQKYQNRMNRIEISEKVNKVKVGRER